MDVPMFAATRRALHGVAELILAGPQHRRAGSIRLRARPGGFGTVVEPDIRVVGDRLVAGTTSVALDGRTYQEVAALVGVEASSLGDVYSDGPGVSPDDLIEIDLDAARRLCATFTVGDAALRAFAPEHEPVLWPEHFDLAVGVGEVNYGVSPGDGGHPEPYAYVGPWEPREGPFWNAAFGALVPLGAEPEVDAVIEFFQAGWAHAGDGQSEETSR